MNIDERVKSLFVNDFEHLWKKAVKTLSVKKCELF